jgi:hypothetical protein
MAVTGRLIKQKGRPKAPRSLPEAMILIDFFDEASCKGTELIEGWYFYDDADDSVVGGPFSNEEAAIKAAFDGHGW